MTINFIFRPEGDVADEEFKETMCFGAAQKKFKDVHRVPGTLIYEADTGKAKEELLKRYPSGMYSPKEFLKELTVNSGPIKTALDIISSMSGGEVVNYRECTCEITTKVPYKIALLPLSIVRLVEEQPTLVYSYLLVREKCHSPTQALLWAQLIHAYAGQFTGHDIFPPYSGVISSCKKVDAILRTPSALVNMTDILGVNYNYKIYAEAAKFRCAKIIDYKHKDRFESYQQKLLELIEENSHDSNNYVTS